MTEVTLTVGGKKYGGWEYARATRGIESISGGFELSVSERWANQNQPWPINEGDECTVSIGETVVITGYVDQISPSFSGGTHSVTISGRDKAGALVDSSAVLGKWEFKTSDVKALAEKVCAQHGIKLSIQAGLTLPRPAEKVSVDPGETGFNLLDEACRKAGVLPVSDGKGGVVLTRASTERCKVELVEGVNIKSCSAAFDSTGRFYKYIVLGQHAANNNFFGTAATRIRGEAFDSEVKRTSRTLVIRASGSLTKADAKRRAEWEANVRAARSTEVTVTVQGWEQTPGELWPVNKLVSLKSPTTRINGTLLITQAVYSVDKDSGTMTTLSLKRPEAFRPEPAKPVKPDGQWRELKGLK